jgi:pyruvate dehydrogenase E2 component (dihydrolipoamide acetyltransferase)
MATAVVMPKLGNTVESSIINTWKKQVGDQVNEGDILCEVETDKATLDVESPVSGTLLALFFGEGDDVPVLVNIAAVGSPDDEFESLRPETAEPAAVESEAASASPTETSEPTVTKTPNPIPAAIATGNGHIGVSPRARNLAFRKQVDVTNLQGTGPGGRIIERDIQAALAAQPRMTPLAQSMLASGEFVTPDQGSGVGGRITTKDLQPRLAQASGAVPTAPSLEDEIETIPVKGARKIIATRMLASLQTTAQLTMNAFADARALLAYRKRLKASNEALGLQKVTINDLVLLAVSRTLTQFPDLNALFDGETIYQYRNVHLAFAVDGPRGLVVPVIRNADSLSLKHLAQTSSNLAIACLEGTVSPDDLQGGTFTVSNLGNLGIETFTPVLNPPQVGILGVGNISLKPVGSEDDVSFIPHIGLSLTINHQVVDGAPAARFLQTLSHNLADLELLLAL